MEASLLYSKKEAAEEKTISSHIAMKTSAHSGLWTAAVPLCDARL